MKSNIFRKVISVIDQCVSTKGHAGSLLITGEGDIRNYLSKGAVPFGQGYA
jgi:hypothetical protein